MLVTDKHRSSTIEAVRQIDRRSWIFWEEGDDASVRSESANTAIRIHGELQVREWLLLVLGGENEEVPRGGPEWLYGKDLLPLG